MEAGTKTFPGTADRPGRHEAAIAGVTHEEMVEDASPSKSVVERELQGLEGSLDRLATGPGALACTRLASRNPGRTIKSPCKRPRSKGASAISGCSKPLRFRLAGHLPGG